MADPHDDDVAFSEHLLSILHVENPTLADLYTTNETPQFYQNPFGQASSSTNNVFIGEPSNQVLWSSGSGGSEPVHFHGESSRAVPPVPSAPIDCSDCHLLRAIIHTNVDDTTRLEIHGRVGFISHIVLHTSVQQDQMFDFSKKSFDDVKQFLKQYCEARLNAGYVMLVDPLAKFYETLTCVVLGKDTNSDGLDGFFGLPIPSSASENEGHMPGSDNPEPSNCGNKGKEPTTRVSLSEQRKRTRKMTVLDVAAFFHLPIAEAAQILVTCPTVLKKICRRHGVERWPYRKVKSIDDRILKLEKTYSNSRSVEERQRVRTEIEKERKEVDEICFGVPEYDPYSARKKQKTSSSKRQK